jgi:hypothetical protein
MAIFTETPFDGCADKSVVSQWVSCEAIEMNGVFPYFRGVQEPARLAGRFNRDQSEPYRGSIGVAESLAHHYLVGEPLIEHSSLS